MKNLKTVIAAVAVFAMTIGSGFAMDNNPPTESLKGKVAAEVVEEAPMQTVYMGSVVYYDSVADQCFEIVNPEHCTLTEILGNQCTITIDDVTYFLYEGVFDAVTNKWTCRAPLYRIPSPF